MDHSRRSSDITRGHFYFQNDQKDQADVTFSKLAWFSYVRKIGDDQEFYCFPTILHFDDKINENPHHRYCRYSGQFRRIGGHFLFQTNPRFLRWLIILWKLKFVLLGLLGVNEQFLLRLNPLPVECSIFILPPWGWWVSK